MNSTISDFEAANTPLTLLLSRVPDHGGDPAAAWRSHSTAVLDAFSPEAVANREFDGAFGRSTIGDTLVLARLGRQL